MADGGEPMFVLVHHVISDPKAFWKDPEETRASIPGHLKLHATYGVSDGTRATCVWECASVESVRQFLDEYSRGIAKNEYFPIDEDMSYGIPGGRLGQRPEQREEAPAPMH
jgi:hypothetical protein